MDRKLRLQIITPERQVLDREVDFVAMPAYEGEMGVLYGHIPFVVQLKEGVFRYKSGPEEEVFAVSGGFVEISNNVISVFAESAEFAEEIDTERARQALQLAKNTIVSGGKDLDINSAHAAIRRAAVRMKIAGMKMTRKGRRKNFPQNT